MIQNQSERKKLKMADPARWLGGNDPREQPRTREEAKQKLSSIPKTEREGLSSAEYGKLKRSAEIGLENKFTRMEPIIGKKASQDQLKSIYSVTMRVEEFRKSLQAFDMADVFQVASSYEKNDEGEYWPAVGARPIDLFSSTQDVDIDTVKQASAFYTMYGQEYHVENLLWSGTKLLNSCDDQLRQKVEEQTIGWPVEHATGPVYFMIMLENILASSPESLRGLINVLQNTSLKDFDGENVIEFVSFARGAIEQLKNNGALPHDALALVASALKDCDTQDFVAYISTMYNNHIQGVKACSVEELLRCAEREYINLTSSPNKWKATKEPKETAFFAGNCYSCGAKGHKATSKDCPLNKGGGTEKEGGGRGFRRGGHGGGRGRGRSGSRGTRGRGGSRTSKDKTPPRAGEQKTRTRNNRTEKWCGRCGYWTWGNVAHVTEDHPNQRQDGNGNVSPAANVATTSSSTSTGTQNQANQTSGDAAPGFGGLAFHALDF